MCSRFSLRSVLTSGSQHLSGSIAFLFVPMFTFGLCHKPIPNHPPTRLTISLPQNG